MATTTFTPSQLRGINSSFPYKNYGLWAPEITGGGGGGGFTNTYSLAFDGVDDYLDISPPIPLGLTSISFWMKSTNSGYDSITNGLGNLGFILTTPLVRLSGSNYRYFADQASKFDGEWHHWFLLIAGSGQSDITNSRLFVDGVEISSGTTATSGTPSSWTNSEIGRGFYGSINASIDEFAIWQSDETANVSTIYNSGVPNDLTSLNPIVWLRNGDNGTFKSPQWLIPNNINVANSRFSNYSFSYDGVNDYINCGNDSSLKPTSAYSISGWFKIDTLATIKTIISNDRNNGFMVWINASNELDFYHWDGSWKILTSTSTFLIDTWYHFSVTWDLSTTTGKLYINGVYNNQNTNFNQIIYLSDPLYIGTYNPSFYFNGNIDDIAVFNKVLTPTEITEIYNSSVPNDISSLSPVGYWRSENSTFLTNWTVTDNGSGGNNGTSVNMTIEDRVGDASNSSNNALSYNMDEADRETDVPS